MRDDKCLKENSGLKNRKEEGKKEKFKQRQIRGIS